MSDWTTELPTETGWYWFYGQQFKDSKPGLQTIQVVSGRNGPVRVCGAAFMYGSELGKMRFFKKMETPELPKGEDEIQREDKRAAELWQREEDQPVRRPRSNSTPDLERHIRDWG